jgi:hypothetical protein
VSRRSLTGVLAYGYVLQRRPRWMTTEPEDRRRKGAVDLYGTRLRA